MLVGSIDFPPDITLALRSDRLVVFAGTGVSMGSPAGLPDFKQLACKIANGTGKRRKSGEPIDVFLGRLAKDDVDLRGLTEDIFDEKDP